MPQLRYIIGIDEVGRGPLAGPVTVCAFAIPEHELRLLDPVGAKDSKQLSEQKRDLVVEKLKELKKLGRCIFHVASTSHGDIDELGLTRAIYNAIEKALKKLNIHPEHADIYLDGGLRAPKKYFRQHTVIKGDAKIAVISCASCIAKVHRDGLMNDYDLEYPQYGFFTNKGYGTPEHIRALHANGPSPIHRASFLGNFDLHPKKTKG